MTKRRRIVVGGDTTPSATAALRWAVGEAAHNPECSVLVVHAFDVVGRADLALERDLDRSRREARYRTQSWVVEVLADADVSVPVMVQTPDGSVEDALVAAAGDALMVVVGEPQNGRRRDLSARLSQRCKCPVVTIGVGPTPALAS
jgi:nucleotide-binding universal stress UspA family protein